MTVTLDRQETQTLGHKSANQPHDIPTPSHFAIEKKAKSVARHNVSVAVFTDRTLYATGGWIEGRVVVRVKKEKDVKLGMVVVEVAGFEETLKKSKSAPGSYKLLVHHSQALQSPYLPPTDLVHPGPPDEHGMWAANAGTFTLPFRLPIGPIAGRPSDEWPESAKNVTVVVSGVMPLPGSFWSAKEGGVRYIIGCTLHSKFHNKPHRPIKAYRDIRVVETAPLTCQPHFSPTFPEGTPFIVEGAKAVKGPYLFGFGERGTVHVKASVRVPEVDDGQWGGQGTLGAEHDGVWIAGGVGFVGVEILNKSKRKVDTLSLTLIRRLKTFADDPNPPQHTGLTTTQTPTLTPVTFARVPVASRTFRSGAVPKHAGKVIASKRYAGDGWAEEEGGALSKRPWEGGNATQEKKGREWWDGVLPGEESNVVVDLIVPAHARSIRYATLVDVSYVVQVAVFVDGDNKPITTEIPITILHPASLFRSLPTLTIHKTTHKQSATALPTTETIEPTNSREALDTFHPEVVEATPTENPSAAIAPSAEAPFYQKRASTATVEETLDRAETLARSSLEEIRRFDVRSVSARRKVSADLMEIPRTVLPVGAESEIGDEGGRESRYDTAQTHQGYGVGTYNSGMKNRYVAPLATFSRSGSVRNTPTTHTHARNPQSRTSSTSLTRNPLTSTAQRTSTGSNNPKPPSPSPAALAQRSGVQGLGLPTSREMNGGRDISPSSQMTGVSLSGVLDGYYGGERGKEEDVRGSIDRMFEGVRSVVV
ncbi:hypothetical protein HDV00_005606 [Rhizophlyctis rosea]|nr:hypothetical protein HDV00_005606 [Rhizophlyctis rosea]